MTCWCSSLLFTGNRCNHFPVGVQELTALYMQVSATSFNEGSSRSHTILRLSVESSERPDVDADPNCSVARTLSFLNLIDLAGSESARAAINRGHRTEGSYINKSLLTLGTVIAKLSDGNAAHIPFRDSKLTRLLQVTSSKGLVSRAPALDKPASMAVFCAVMSNAQSCSMMYMQQRSSDQSRSNDIVIYCLHPVATVPNSSMQQ